MATFTPPTHTEYFAPPGVDRLWSRVPYQRGNAVLIEAGWDVSTYPGLQVVDGDTLQDREEDGYAYLGAVTYEIGPAELAALIGAGYGAYITVASPGVAATTISTGAKAVSLQDG